MNRHEMLSLGWLWRHLANVRLIQPITASVKIEYAKQGTI